MRNVGASGILSNDVKAIWPIVAPQIMRALGAGLGELTLQTIYEGLERAEMQLWVVGDNETGDDLGVVVTQVQPTGVTCFLNVLLCAGVEMKEWKDLIGILESFGLDRGCEYVKVHGRKGWKRVLAPNGYEERYVVLTKPLFRRH